MAKNKKPIDELTSHYKRNKVANIIKNTSVDTEKLGYNDESAKEYIYDKYHIRQYKNYQDFKEDLQKNSAYEDSAIPGKWREYQHRDMLIETGQYEDIRFKIYQEKYVKGMRNVGYSESEVMQVERLTTKDFRALSLAKSFDKSKHGDTLLPQLEEIYYPQEKDEIKLNEYRTQMKDAFNMIDKTFYSEGDTIEDSELKLDIEKRITNRNKRLKRIKKYLVNQLGDDSISVNDDLETIVSELKSNGIDVLTRSSNNISLGRLGSVNGKNSDIVLDIYELYRKDYY